MNKAFVKEDAPDEEEGRPAAPALPAGTKNYMTRRGYGLLRNELEELVKRERPALVQVVSWAAKNGDRSENGDYIYGKKRLRLGGDRSEAGEGDEYRSRESFDAAAPCAGRDGESNHRAVLFFGWRGICRKARVHRRPPPPRPPTTMCRN